MGFVVEMSGPKGWRRLRHLLFECPSFWQWRRAFSCPLCGKKYRCYWDGGDANGHINLCRECYPQQAALERSCADPVPEHDKAE